jgi:hypothetical protein
MRQGPDFTRTPLTINLRRKKEAAAATLCGLVLGGIGIILWVQHEVPRFVSGFFLLCAALFVWLLRRERQRIHIADGIVQVTERRWFGDDRVWEEPYFAYRGIGRTRFADGEESGRVIHTLHLLHPDERKALVLHESQNGSLIDRLGREAAEILRLPRLNGDGSTEAQ